jgi:hypothetical protein
MTSQTSNAEDFSFSDVIGWKKVLTLEMKNLDTKLPCLEEVSGRSANQGQKSHCGKTLTKKSKR